MITTVLYLHRDKSENNEDANTIFDDTGVDLRNIFSSWRYMFGEVGLEINIDIDKKEIWLVSVIINEEKVKLERQIEVS